MPNSSDIPLPMFSLGTIKSFWTVCLFLFVNSSFVPYFFLPHGSDIKLAFLFLTSFRIIISRSAHVTANSIISFFYIVE